MQKLKGGHQNELIILENIKQIINAEVKQHFPINEDPSRFIEAYENSLNELDLKDMIIKSLEESSLLD